MPCCLTNVTVPLNGLCSAFKVPLMNQTIKSAPSTAQLNVAVDPSDTLASIGLDMITYEI